MCLTQNRTEGGKCLVALNTLRHVMVRLNVFNTFKMGLLDLIFRKKKKKPTRARARTVQKRKKKKKKKEQQIAEHITLKDWKEEIQRLQAHPLTQAKLMNESLLNLVMDLFEQINNKLDELNTRIDRMEAKKTKVKIRHEKPEAKLSQQEQRILAYTKAQKIVQAGPIARKLRISRSNASLKLNKLYSIGYLDKQQDGKDVHYSLKK